MGLFGLDSQMLFDPLDVTGEMAGERAKEAAELQAHQYRKGLRELRRQFNTSQRNIAPFMQAGQEALPFLQQGATPGGLDEILNEIMGGDLFQGLLEERTRSVEGMLSSGGLTRSGAAIEEGEKLPTDLAFMISEILNGRADQLATRGQNAAVGAGTQSGQFGTNAANLMGQQGNALASGVLGQQQAKAQGQQNMLALASLFGNRG